MDLRSIFCTVSGLGDVAVTCSDQLDKPTIVFLHGMQGSRALFSPLMSEPFLESYHLIAPDLLGFGESSKPNYWNYDLESHASIVEQLLHRLQVNEAIVIGHSLGGMIGTLLLDSSTIRVRGLISLEGNLLIEDCSMSNEVAKLSLEQFSHHYFINYKSQLAHSSEPSAPFRAESLSHVDEVAFYKTSRSIVAWSKSGKLKELFEHAPCQKLLITGARSSFHTQVNAPSCQQSSIADAGHFLLHDSYDSTKQLMWRFLKHLRNSFCTEHSSTIKDNAYLANAFTLTDERTLHTQICNGTFDSIIPGMKLTAGCSQGSKVHLEGDVATHTAKVICTLAKISTEDPAAQFDSIDLLAALMHDVEKATTRLEDATGNVSFPGHEEKAANRVSAVAQALSLSRTQKEKLEFLVREHGAAHSFPTLTTEEQQRLLQSPWWRNLRLLQKADALSCYLTPDGSTHLAVHWELFEKVDQQ